jgi:hypothetical protein
MASLLLKLNLLKTLESLSPTSKRRYNGGNFLPASMKCDYLCSCAKWVIRL